MRLHGIDRDAFDRYTSNMPAWFYQVVAPGFKYNMTDVAAAIGIHQLRKLDRFVHRRAELARRYDDAFRGACLRLPTHAPSGETHAWHLYVVRLNDEAAVSRDEFINRMTAAGIGTSVHFIPLHLHPYWRDTYHLLPERFANATRAFKHVVSLPLYTRMTDADQDRVIRATLSILAQRRSFVAVPETAGLGD
jgi:dTDP-4-amino-4,6-dideoxygalactose transaminase